VLNYSWKASPNQWGPSLSRPEFNLVKLEALNILISKPGYYYDTIMTFRINYVYYTLL
jgi:hypothetical protein